MPNVFYPSLLQVNTRVWLAELSQQAGRALTLADTPEAALDAWAAAGFDWVYLLGVWETGPAGRKVSFSHPEWWQEVRHHLPDFKDDDVCGSPFAVRSYTVHPEFGGNEALLRLRERLRARGLRLLLDFVPNHTAPDHRWAEEWPEFYIQGEQDDLLREPTNYRLVMTARGPAVLAHGRDPHFPAWANTLQLNYRHAVLREAMMEELTNLTRLGDGVRCDMAMLLLPEIIQSIWGAKSLPRDGSAPVDTPFWPEAISRTIQHVPGFMFVAEVYWDLEWTLQRQGFDYTYDKRHYDRLCARDPLAVRGHLQAEADFQRKSVRFLENHDEPRIAAVLPLAEHRAAALLTFLVPGLRYFHEGQLEGRRIRPSLHLGRRPAEPVDVDIAAFYRQLLALVARPEVRGGAWRLLEVAAAVADQPPAHGLIAFAWELEGRRLLVVVNYAAAPGTGYVPLPWPDVAATPWPELLTGVVHQPNGELKTRGLFVGLPAWGALVLEVPLGANNGALLVKAEK